MFVCVCVGGGRGVRGLEEEEDVVGGWGGWWVVRGGGLFLGVGGRRRCSEKSVPAAWERRPCLLRLAGTKVGQRRSGRPQPPRPPVSSNFLCRKPEEGSFERSAARSSCVSEMDSG